MNQNKISFVMTGRDDNYESDGVKDYTIKRIKATVESIISLNVNSEIIFVEFCPDHGSIAEKLKDYPVKVITLKRELLNVLDKDAPKIKIPFYEYLAKDYGIKSSTGDYVIACNPDNIFPSTNFDEVIKDLEAGFIVLGVRNEIDRAYADVSPKELIELANNDKFTVMTRFSSASGDFTGMKKSIYNELGGYILMHGNWHCDNEFIERALIGGYNMSRPYSYYHLNHSKDFMGAKGRPTDFQNFKLISKKILKGLKKYELA